MPTQAEIVAATNEYLIPNYGRLPLAMARGAGARLWDADGREYIDFFPGFGAGGVTGHCHPAVVDALQSQAETLISCGNLFTNAPQVELARTITEHAFGGKVFYCHSGAEANEAALKLARLAAGEGEYKIISFHRSFHGRTMGALSLTPAKYQKRLEPMLPGNVMLDYGDLDAVKAAIDDETAGVILEPIQGEGGVNVPSKSFLQGLRELCTEKGILMICDEVWTAPARTGKWFSYQHFDIEPDVMTLAKAIAGGTPLAACVASPKYADVLQPGTHGCTVGGNPLCAAAALATMKLIENEDLVARAAEEGKGLLSSLREADVSCIKDIRGFGFMIGIELDRPGKDIMAACMDRGLLINCTQETVLRIAPPLTADDTDLSEGMEIFIEVLKQA